MKNSFFLTVLSVFCMTLSASEWPQGATQQRIREWHERVEQRQRPPHRTIPLEHGAQVPQQHGYTGRQPSGHRQSTSDPDEILAMMQASQEQYEQPASAPPPAYRSHSSEMSSTPKYEADEHYNPTVHGPFQERSLSTPTYYPPGTLVPDRTETGFLEEFHSELDRLRATVEQQYHQAERVYDLRVKRARRESMSVSPPKEGSGWMKRARALGHMARGKSPTVASAIAASRGTQEQLSEKQRELNKQMALARAGTWIALRRIRQAYEEALGCFSRSGLCNPPQAQGRRFEPEEEQL